MTRLTRAVHRLVAAFAALPTVTAASAPARASTDPKAPGTSWPALRTVDPTIIQEMRCFTPYGPQENPGVSRPRELAEEWWHHTCKPEPYPDAYVDLPVSAKSLTNGH